MADVFLSYARGDASEAQRFAAQLRSAGFSVWFDEQLPAHRAFGDVIEEQLEQASAIVVLWSQQAAASQWVRSEANRGREKGRLVQIRLDDARLPMPFDQVQCADLRRWDGSATAPAWRAVITGVAELAGRAPANDDAPASGMGKAGARRRGFMIAGGAAAALAA